MSRPDTEDFATIFLNDLPLMDVRAPIEFAKGAFPSSLNLPILDNRQRELVGTCYKQHGQEAAIALGLELATPDIRQQRLMQWLQFVKQHPDGYLYCFRGGLRSRTTQAWLKEQGHDYPLVKGGYKAMRRYLLAQMAHWSQQIPLIILAGMTGTGKTRVLQKTPCPVDLEGLAQHKGSAFGRNALDFQPSQIDFENALSIALLKHAHRHQSTPLLLEDEGRMIGRLILPEDLLHKMTQAPRLLLERSMPERIQIIREDYIEQNWPQYQHHYGDQAEAKFSAFVLNNLERIKNRLGGNRFQEIHQAFRHALNQLFYQQNSAAFDAPIFRLLTDYYDPMYQYQLKKKPVSILFKGNETELLDWINHHLKVTS